LKLYSNGKKICAIGDGGNDVGMMNEADLAISIAKKNSVTAAAIASEISVTQFGHLNDVVLKYGLCSYHAKTKAAYFIFYRGFTIAIIQSLFTMINHFVLVPLYNDQLQLAFTTLYLVIPVFLVLFIEVNGDREELIKEYKQSRKGRDLNVKKFLEIMFLSIY